MEIEEYFEGFSSEFNKAYAVAAEARQKGFDPSKKVEILPAPDLASRVEGLIGSNGIADLIRSKGSGISRSKLAFDVVKTLCSEEGSDMAGQMKKIELAVRVGTAILTEGVLVAPTEGIQAVKRYRNQDGTDYVAVVYAGPIRGAGGTAAALSVALADYARRLMHIGDYKPTKEEIERCVEETELYHTRAARLQYRPADDDIRIIAGNCPICIDGVPSETVEVSVHSNLQRLDENGKPVQITNKVRSGMPLVMCEGIAQKAKKLLKETKGVGLDWSWLGNTIKAEIKKTESNEEKATAFLEELVAGRPILAYPGKIGGFRLRYGRSRFTGIASKGVSPATMIITGSFMAIGTQLKIELPGKGCIVTPVDSIEGPFVKLRSGDAFRVNDAATAMKIRDEVEEIISLGDMLVTYGDFRKSNTKLQPSSYVEELWGKQLKAAGGEYSGEEINFAEALGLSIKYGLPIHPKFLFEFQAVGVEQLAMLQKAVADAVMDIDGKAIEEVESVKIPASQGVKRALELLTVPHRLLEGMVVVYGDYAQSLLCSLGLLEGRCISARQKEVDGEDAVDAASRLAPFKVVRRSTFIGARVGRPEKARERLMKPAPNVLFPIGISVSKDRDVSKAFLASSKKFRSEINVELARYKCQRCSRVVDTGFCYDCQEMAPVERRCPQCGKIVHGETCVTCNVQYSGYEDRKIDLIKVVTNARKKLGLNKVPDGIKGVKGLTSRDKVAEPVEKGMLRAMYGIFIFKDGTARFDATDVPITHFYPKEIGVGVDKLMELGYDLDYKDAPLESESQLVEMKHQDVILSRRGAEYLLRVSKFIDDLLVRFYGQEKYYNASSVNDLIGQMVITLSPHTSCGVLGRIIGFTDVNVGFAHPYTISARRRNCDGDEDTTMLLLDALINFSRAFLPSSVGGTMDTPLILSVNIMPEEVDDEAHAMEIVDSYPLEFYEKTMAFAPPSEANIELVENRLGNRSVFSGLAFTHASSQNAVFMSPKRSSYTQFKTMQDKVDAEFRLMDSIYAIDKGDAARKLILSHFIPDLIGNLHSYSRQIFRCSVCNAKYRRIPLKGKCPKDDGRLLLTISKGGIEKYLEMAIALAERYNLDPYIRQRLELIKEEIGALFAGEVSDGERGQFNLGRYM